METSDAGNHMLISMWKVAAYDWSTCELALLKRLAGMIRGLDTLGQGVFGRGTQISNPV